MMPRQHQSLDRRHLAAALRDLRESTGLSAQRFGAPMGWSQGKVSKIENGRTVPSPEDAAAWAAAAKASSARAAELAELAEKVGTERRAWGDARQGTLAVRNEEVRLATADATAVRVFQPAVVPGLLQTADYARHVFTMLGADEQDVASAVNARMQRQDVLYGTGRQFEFVLTEGALRWRPGSRQMMVAQFDRVLSVATLPNVDIRVLMFAVQAPALYIGGFTIYEIPDDPHVLVETLKDEARFRREADLDVFRSTFERCKEAALAGDAAMDTVRGLRRDLIDD